MLTLLPDLNVAPLKYAHVHREHGGPVHALNYVERTLAEGVFFDATVDLESRCVGPLPGPHGRGFAATKADAIHAAISDAMALWAFTAATRDPTLSAALRFDLDPTRYGFAAFPGLGVQGAHKRALFAAAEKWALGTWWHGRLAHTELQAPGVQAIQIRAGIPGVSVVITWGVGSYGVGTAATPVLAHAAARMAMLRNRDRDDARFRYFTGALGMEAFRTRLASPGPRLPPSPPKPLLETAVPGPWQQYAHVWRCLFDCSAFREKDKDETFFL